MCQKYLLKIYIFQKNISRKREHDSRPGLEKSSLGPEPSVSVGPFHGSHPKILSSELSTTQLHKLPIVSKSQPNRHSVTRVVKITSYCAFFAAWAKYCSNRLYLLKMWWCDFFFLPGQAPSLMTILSRAVSHEEEKPRLASNTILKIKPQ